MTARLLPVELQRTERRLRLITILDSCRRGGLSPVNIATVHGIAYLADALAPVWHLPILDGQILKQNRPFFPALQADLDSLVGQGVVHVARLTYQFDRDDQSWRLDADYVLAPTWADRILGTASQFEEQAKRIRFVREVTFAASGLGPAGIEDVGLIDAAYSNPQVDLGGIVDIDPDSGQQNATASVALRFADLTQDMGTLTDSELVHLYVRHLYSRMQVA